MRILSQEGMQIQDLPYEKTRVYIEKDGITVKGLFDGIIFDLAKYSTEAKARKAMEMLRDRYTGKDETVFEIAHIKRSSTDNFYFQFPSDDEVEV